MAEEENMKKGRLVAAVFAGSALAFSSFAFGAPAALAQGEADQEEQTEQESSDAGTKSPAPESSPSATEEQDADDSDEGDAEGEVADEEAGDDQPSASANATSEETEDEKTTDEHGGDFGTQQLDSDVSLDKSQVWPGDTVTVTGSGFTTDAELVISLVENEIDVTEGPRLGTVTTDNEGAFTATVTIPEDTQPRDYSVEVYDEADLHTFGVPLDVLDDSDVEVDPSVYTNPRSGPAGSTISISGSGYSPYGEIELSLTPTADGDSIPLDSVTASSNGMLEEFEYSLPDSIDNGVYVLTAVDAQSGEETTNEFNVTDVTLEIAPETIPEEDFARAPSEGGGVTHTVEGLEPGAEVDFNVGNAYNPMEDLSGSATADENGVAEYVVYDSDSVYIGSYGTTVTLSDGTQVAHGNFEVTSEEPQASIPADDVAPGESIFLSGSNFSPDTNVTMNWDLDDPMTTQADSQGRFSHEIVVPDGAESGTYEIEVTDETSGKSTTVELSVGTSDEDETPVVEPEISLDATDAYQGEMVGMSGAGFTPDGEVELVLDSEVVSVVADENGELTDAAVQVPRDLAAGTYDVVARDVETEEEAIAELTVVEADEPVLRVSPEEITLDEFVRDDEDDDDSGVVHTVAGLEPGADIEAVVDGPEGVQTVERDETANENGVAEFVIYGYDLDDPTSYLGVYDTEITIVEDDADPLQGSFEVIANQDDDDDDGETPAGPSIELDANSVYPGDTLSVTGSDFTPEGDVTLEWNPSIDASADADGNIDADLTIPEDTEPGVKELTVTDETSGDQTSAEFTVLDPTDQVTEPALAIDPEEIAVGDFMGDPEDDAGVDHKVQGAAPGSEITYVVTGPEGVNDFESSGTVSDDGTAEFVIYAPEISNPGVYLGEYTTVVTYENEDGEAGELQGTFTVVDGSAGTGSGNSDDQADPVGDSGGPVDLNGADKLAQTGATNVQLGLIAGLLLAIGGAFVVYSNRARLFPRKK